MSRAVADPVSERIEALLTELRLPSMRQRFRQLTREVTAQGGSYQAYLLALLEEEVSDRTSRRVERRLKEARFRQMKLLGELDLRAEPMPSPERVSALAGCGFIAAGENVLALGNSGTGKTHLATGLGIEACKRGYRVRFWPAATLAAELEAAQAEHQLHRYLNRFGSWDVVIIDELGYLPLSKAGAELLFTAISERHERRSVMITTNLPFSEWVEVFHGERLTAALLDRVTHRAHILEMNGPSYRLTSALAQSRGEKQTGEVI